MPVATARPPAWSLADAILRMIWEARTISRAELARRAGLSRSTVSEIVTMLLDTTLVREAGVGESQGGRRPIVLAFQDDACSILGVDMGATHVRVLLSDLRGRVLASQQREFPARTDPTGARTLITALCEACRQTAGDEAGTLLGIGIGVPSPVDPRAPERVSEVAMPAWGGRHGFEAIAAHFGVPLRVDNDATLGALAERWWGAARGLDDVAFVKGATGVGAGHVVAGRSFRGAHGVAGEIGHLTIDASGPPCNCGNRGCLQTYVGTAALEDRARALHSRHPGSRLLPGDAFTRRFVEAAHAGDVLALRMVDEIAEHLGVAVASMLNLMNPDAVIFGGGLAALGDLLLVPLRETVRRRTFVSAVASTRILASPLEPLGVALGAATLILDAALHDPSLFPTIPHG